MSEFGITFNRGEPIGLTDDQAVFFQTFWETFIYAVTTTEKIDVEPSIIENNTFFLMKSDGGCFVIKPIERQIFEGDSDLKVVSGDFTLSYQRLTRCLDELENKLFGEIEIKVIQVTPLSEALEGLLITLYYYADLMIKAGEEKFESGFCKVQEETLYVRLENGTYLGINPSGHTSSQKKFYTDANLNPDPQLFSIDVVDLAVIVDEIRRQLIIAQIIKPDDF